MSGSLVAAATGLVEPPHFASVPDLAELAEVSAAFEHQPASAVVAWAWERYGTSAILAASFQDCVLIDVAVQVVPDIEVVFLDTQYHFAETLWFRDQVRERYDLDLTVIEPRVAPDDLWATNPDECCRLRKVEPLDRALAGRNAWMTGLRRDEAASRTTTPIVSYDVSRDLVKVNPLAAWTGTDVAGYVRDHDLPVHPLAEHGYSSIGCWPCTRPITEGEDPRAGRWSGVNKTECGLHE